MQARRSERALPAGLAVAAYVLALLQRPGTVVADTKVDLYVDPGGFLAEVASAWTGTGQLGHVFAGQYGGYLFPMAPWFAGGDALGIPTWIVHRLWLGTLFAVAAWGVVRLLDVLWPARGRGAPHAAAAVLYVLNPYVAVYANRTSVALLAYAALPWLLLAVHRGLRDPRGWRYPALFALALTCTGGGVNAATTAWILLGPLLLVVYERTLGGVPRGAIVPFALRLVPVALLANVWWVVPVLLHARHGLDFLPFTEQPGTIWQTTSVTESLRLTGFWTSYIGIGFGGLLQPFASHGSVLLFSWPVVVASLLVPGLVLLGFAWTRRWRYGPFFLLLALAGLLVMVAGWPEGTPLRRALTFTYNHVEAVRFLRTTYKAGPLLALGLACLGGAAFALAWARWRWLAAVAALALAAVAAWPLSTGTAPERKLAFEVPSWWDETARDVDRLPDDRRALVLPGRLFAFYDWGGTIDPILPSLADQPVTERTIVPYSDLRSVDLLWAVDGLVQQERALPGQLAPLADLLGAGAIVTAADGDRALSGEVGAVEAGDVLAQQAGLGAPRALGPWRREQPAAGRVREGARLPRVAVRPVETGGVVRLLPREPLTVVDGGAEGVAALAAFGALDPSRPLAYAADLGEGELRRAHEVVVTDTNRRQAFVAARSRSNRGFVMAADQDVSEDGTLLDPFGAGPDGQTVALLRGVRSVRAPFSPQITQFPEHRAFAALDGDPETAWLADRALARDRHWVEVRLDRPRRVDTVEVIPYSDERGRVRRIAVNGREVAVREGVNRVPVGGTVDRIRVAILDVSQPGGDVSGGAGGIRELRISGVDPRETLRPPVLAERAADASASLTYLLSRTTVDAPLRSGPPAGPFQSYLPRDRRDPEAQLARTIAPRDARRFTADAWVSAEEVTDEAELDRLAGARGAVRARSSGAYGGIPAFRASSAFDGDEATAWIGAFARAARLEVTLPRAASVRRLRLVPPRDAVRLPERVRVGGTVAAVGADGSVTLPRRVRGRRIAIDVLAARFPEGTPGRLRMRRAVGIAEVRGIPGARVEVPRRGPLRSRCGDARLRTAGGDVELRVEGGAADLDAARPLRGRACAPVALPAGEQDVEGLPALLKVDHLRLRAEGGGAASGGAAAAGAEEAGSVLDPGDPGRGERTGVRVDVRAPAWLVLGESYGRGWRAECDGSDLGAPRPMQGFANAWPVRPGCREVAFAWAPNRLLPAVYVISLLACAALVLVLARTRRRAKPAADLAELPDAEPQPWPLRRALAAGLGAALVVGFVFALRAGAVAGPAVALILWRGVPARHLVFAAGALLLVVVPILYLAVGVDDPGGYNSNLAVERIAAHWVGVAAVLLLSAAMARVAAAARSGPSGRGSTRTTEPGRAGAPSTPGPPGPARTRRATRPGPGTSTSG